MSCIKKNASTNEQRKKIYVYVYFYLTSIRLFWDTFVHVYTTHFYRKTNELTCKIYI